MSVTGGIMAGVGLAGSIGGAVISGNAASDAASQQSAAAQQSAQLQYQASQNALGFQQQQYNTSQQQAAPWLHSGAGALSNLDYLMGVGGQPQQQPQGMGVGASGGPMQSPAGPDGGGGFGGASPSGGPMSGGGQMQRGPDGQIQMLAGGSPVNRGGLGIADSPNSQMNGGPQGMPNGAMPGGIPNQGSPNQGGMYPSPNTSQGGFGSLMAPYSGGNFVAPTAQQALASPGEQAQMELGSQALQQSAAARGNVLTGGTAQALEQYAQGLASTNYQNVYSNAYNTHANNYNQYQQQQQNQFNRLSSMSGGGQQAAAQLGQLGQASANGISNNLLSTASNMGQQYNNAAAANASGIVGGANAWSGALGGSANNISQLAIMNNLFKNGGGSGSVPTAPMSMYGG